ncbi:hypothetical protein BJI69_14225 [Luteibacter rhizovicinus DSM 16549]|uniref:Uncharacterized protein n=1 Tax=Luteibacter rhizovicinus DSM 16549 TaxID=1440763 RepID=A0A0G9HFA7_9GAMM|nr:hypothetical protein [Luteibacter rhizovicinus]APG04934.1 hypothetical protein BJI69_14225 [Luteibacter rhizovicinus DSM 16549]KLD68465.1 hypothetical protein Y883_01935 [Luteibacter rhizovicinus DSM 16549]KLD76763.1 hypothetical protein Y886_19600 [Xanthomonas hyacinthi DSM 19077]
MHDKVIDDLVGMARHFHRLVDESSATGAQAVKVTALGMSVMKTLFDVFEPSADQMGELRKRFDAVLAEHVGDAAKPAGSVH